MILALDGDSSNHTTVFKWYREFQMENFSQGSHKCLDRRVTSNKTLFYLVSYYLTENQETQRVTHCQQTLKMFDKVQSRYLNNNGIGYGVMALLL